MQRKSGDTLIDRRSASQRSIGVSSFAFRTSPYLLRNDAVASSKRRLGARKHVVPFGYRSNSNPPVEEERPLAGRGFEPCAPRLEAAAVLLRHDSEGRTSGDRAPGNLTAPVGGAVVDQNDLGVEAAVLERPKKSLDRLPER